MGNITECGVGRVTYTGLGKCTDGTLGRFTDAGAVDFGISTEHFSAHLPLFVDMGCVIMLLSVRRYATDGGLGTRADMAFAVPTAIMAQYVAPPVRLPRQGEYTIDGTDQNGGRA